MGIVIIIMPLDGQQNVMTTLFHQKGVINQKSRFDCFIELSRVLIRFTYPYQFQSRQMFDKKLLLPLSIQLHAKLLYITSDSSIEDYI